MQAALRGRAATEGLEWDMTTGVAGERWGCRTEHFLTHLRERPGHRETEISMRIADEFVVRASSPPMNRQRSDQ